MFLQEKKEKKKLKCWVFYFSEIQIALSIGSKGGKREISRFFELDAKIAIREEEIRMK